MSHQPCVTKYLTRKRYRDTTEPSKRKKLNDGDVFLVDTEVKGKSYVAKPSESKTTKKSISAKKKKQIPIHQATRPIKDLLRVATSKIPAKEYELQIEGVKCKVRASTSNVGFDSGVKDSVLPCPTGVEASHNQPAARSLLDIELPEVIDESEKSISPTKAVLNKHPIFAESSASSSVKVSEAAISLRSSSEKSKQNIALKVNAVKATVASSSAQTTNVQDSLKGKNKLKDLQDTLLKIKQLKEKTKLLHVQNQTKLKKVATEKREYACTKYHSLAQAIPKGLLLPYKYEVLADMFRSLDTVCSMLFNRKETITWSKIKQAVQDMTKKNFELAHLSQIKHIFPGAYRFRQESNIVNFISPEKRSDYELTLQPIIEQEAKNVGNDVKMTGSELIKRRHHFHVQLIENVKMHHRNFLQTLDPPIDIQDDELKRWHPRFQLDLLTELPTSDLPQPPYQAQLECTSAKEVLKKTRSPLTQKATAALKKAVSLCTDNDTSNNQSKAIPPSLPASIGGISINLLKKIREKEAKQKYKMMSRNDDENEKLQRMKNLPHVARALRSLFVDEKKASLPISFIKLKLSKCCAVSSSPDAVERHLRLLCDQLPSWFVISSVRTHEYGRIIDKQMAIGDVINKLQCQLKTMKQS